jgi:hypothetical protein
MSVRVRAFIYFAILILLCGMLMPSNPSNPIVFADKLKDFWRRTHMPDPPPAHPWSYQTHLATDTWEVFPPSAISPKLMNLRTQDWLRNVLSKTNETVACVGEITGVDLESANLAAKPPRLYEHRTIAHFRTLKPLTTGCPDTLSIYSRWVQCMSASGPIWTYITDTRHQFPFACGDRILAILGKNTRIESEFSPVWEVIIYWQFRNSAFDRAQYIYRTVDSGLDQKALERVPSGYRGHLSAFCWRQFETRGETLQEGIDAIEALYASTSTAVVHE